MFALMPWMSRSPLFPRRESAPASLAGEFESLFNRFFTNPLVELPEVPIPWGMTTEETEKEVVVRIELPGFEREELTVTLRGETLAVVAEHREPAAKTENAEERGFARVNRELTLPPGVELEKAEAIYRNGVLEVRIPRLPEVAGRRIEVKT